MKLLLSLALLFSFVLITPAAPWHNGPETKVATDPFFGGHDWVVWKAYMIARPDMRNDFINNKHELLMALTIRN
jgi:hypothetical protein